MIFTLGVILLGRDYDRSDIRGLAQRNFGLMSISGFSCTFLITWEAELGYVTIPIPSCYELLLANQNQTPQSIRPRLCEVRSLLVYCNPGKLCGY
jgi:hypothetical protein